jgi:hypothetical protein
MGFQSLVEMKPMSVMLASPMDKIDIIEPILATNDPWT